MDILVSGIKSYDNKIRLLGETKNIKSVDNLALYLVANTQNFSLSSVKKYQHLVTDKDGFKYDEFSESKDRELILECPNDSILMDKVFGMPDIKWG